MCTLHERVTVGVAEGRTISQLMRLAILGVRELAKFYVTNLAIMQQIVNTHIRATRCYNGDNNSGDKLWLHVCILARCMHVSIGEFLVQYSRKNYSTIPNVHLSTASAFDNWNKIAFSILDSSKRALLSLSLARFLHSQSKAVERKRLLPKDAAWSIACTLVSMCFRVHECTCACVRACATTVGERNQTHRVATIDLPGRGDAERLEDLQVPLGRILRLPRFLRLPCLLRLAVVGRHSAKRLPFLAREPASEETRSLSPQTRHPS